MGRRRVEQRTIRFSCAHCDYNVTSEKALDLHLKYSHHIKPTKEIEETYSWGCLYCKKYNCKHYKP